MALYALYAQARAACRAPACQSGGRCPGCHLTDDHVHERRGEIRNAYATARPGAESKRMTTLLGASGHDADELSDFRDWLEQTRSRLHRALEAAVGRGPRGQLYRVSPMDAATGEGRRRRGLALAPRFIRGVERPKR